MAPLEKLCEIQLAMNNKADLIEQKVTYNKYQR